LLTLELVECRAWLFHTGIRGSLAIPLGLGIEEQDETLVMSRRSRRDGLRWLKVSSNVDLFLSRGIGNFNESCVVMPLLQHYTPSNSGSFIEEKGNKSHVHYRNADPEFDLGRE
jgi:hypothetical protein